MMFEPLALSSQHLVVGGHRKGFTLTELLVVIGIILLLTAAAVTVSGYVTKKAKIRTTKATLGMLVSALQAYKEYEDRGSGFDFPPSPYTMFINNGGTIEARFTMSIKGTVTEPGRWPNAVNTEHLHVGDEPESWDGLDTDILEEAQLSIEVLYLFLDDVPASREVLNKLSGSTTVNLGSHGVDLDGDGTDDKSLIGVIDGWKLPLRYETRGSGNFPLISSAGPDGVFDTADDILSSEL